MAYSISLALAIVCHRIPRIFLCIHKWLHSSNFVLQEKSNETHRGTDMLESGSMFLTQLFQQCSFSVLSGNQESRGLAHHGFLKNLVQRGCHCQCCLKAEILNHITRFYLSQHLSKDSIDFSVYNNWDHSFTHWKGIDNK